MNGSVKIWLIHKEIKAAIMYVKRSDEALHSAILHS